MPGNDHEETLLRSTGDIVAGMPVLECTNCHFQADHFFFYDDATYAHRAVKRCPRCGMRIFGAVVTNAK